MSSDKLHNEIAIIGMSPGNSYFKDDSVEFLFSKVSCLWDKFVIFVPDTPAIETYKSLGYEPSKARSKAILKGNNLKNRSFRIAEKLDLLQKMVVVDWDKDVVSNISYEEEFRKIQQLYQENSSFRQCVHETTGAVLKQSGKDISNFQAATEQASHYLLSELAFLEFATELFSVEKIVYVYHRSWPIYERYISGDFGIKKNERLGFHIIAKKETSL